MLMLYSCKMDTAYNMYLVKDQIVLNEIQKRDKSVFKKILMAIRIYLTCTRSRIKIDKQNVCERTI